MPASSHPAASKIPRPSDRPAVVSDPDDLEELAWGPGYTPGGISDYLTADRPVLGLRVNSFTDTTIATLQWQHVAFDALGMQYVVEGWNNMLWGDEDDIPDPCEMDPDPFDALAKGSRPTTEEHVLSKTRVGLGGMLKWGLGYGVDMLLRAKENRMVCVPQTYWQAQLDKALDELREEALANGEDVSKVFLTENDVLTAWIMRCVITPLDMSPDRPVSASCLPAQYPFTNLQPGEHLHRHVPTQGIRKRPHSPIFRAPIRRQRIRLGKHPPSSERNHHKTPKLRRTPSPSCNQRTRNPRTTRSLLCAGPSTRHGTSDRDFWRRKHGAGGIVQLVKSRPV